ncbi:MAG: PASTA domain-containing protein [Armatimonas sp.]
MEGLTEFQPKTIAHTLFMDFVGYSRLPAAAQAQVQQTLNNLANNTPTMQTRLRSRSSSRAELLVKRMGDGMAMIFFDDLEAPLKVAIEIDEQIKRTQNRLREQIGGTAFRVRMGVHSGSVIVIDEGGEIDVAGEGINIAQRVMDAGDEGHILISDVVAQALLGNAEWRALFDDLGMCRVKHDELVHLHNVHGVRDDGTTVGNEALPPRVRMTQETVQQLIERDAEIARQGEREIARSFFSKTVLIVGGFAAVVGLCWMVINATGKAIDKNIANKKTLASARVKPTPAANQATPDPAASPAPGENGSGTGNPGPNGLVGSADAQVPDLKGMEQSAALEKLSAMGLRLALSQRAPSRTDPTVPAGRILDQFPAAKARANNDGTVYVTLSSGPGTGGSGQEVTTSGVIIDMRSQNGFTPNTNAYLAGPGGQPLPIRFQFTTDEAQAAQFAGGSPLKLSPSGDNSGSGIVLSAEDLVRLGTLPAEAQSHIVVLHR